MIQISKFWNINKILPYQRHFNFINGERSIGKSYTTQKWLLKQALTKHKCFIYLVRTSDQKKKGAFGKAFTKVCTNEYKNIEFEFDTENAYKVERDENDKIINKTLIGHCIALSEAVKIKLNSYPYVYYIMMDEYMLERSQGAQYVNGWHEPDLLLSIYHTVDREEDRVTVFLLGNNTEFFNPYHMHSAFKIKPCEKGGMSLGYNTLYQWATSSNELKEDKEQCMFLKMIKGTTYSQYAQEGDFIDDNYSFIDAMPPDGCYQFTIYYDKKKYGVFTSRKTTYTYITDKVDNTCPLKVALSNDDHDETTILMKGKNPLFDFLSKEYRHAHVRFSSMEVKTHIEEGIKKWL